MVVRGTTCNGLVSLFRNSEQTNVEFLLTDVWVMPAQLRVAAHFVEGICIRLVLSIHPGLPARSPSIAGSLRWHVRMDRARFFTRPADVENLWAAFGTEQVATVHNAGSGWPIVPTRTNSFSLGARQRRGLRSASTRESVAAQNRTRRIMSATTAGFGWLVITIVCETVTCRALCGSSTAVMSVDVN